MRELRSALDDVSPDILVGGQTAIDVDGNAAATTDRTLIIPLVLLAVLLVLMLLLRALVAPLLLVASVALSYAAALGFSAIIFNYGVRVLGRRSDGAAVRLRVPDRARRRLQHLPDDACTRGGASCTARAPACSAGSC